MTERRSNEPMRLVRGTEAEQEAEREAERFADSTLDLVRVIRLLGVEEESNYLDPNAPRHQADSWLTRHVADMADAFIEVLAERLRGREPSPRSRVLRFADRFLSPREVCALLQIDRSTLKRWERDGHVPPSIRIDGMPRWNQRALEAWFKQRGTQR
jgi:predicted DNA-binding transcriptional regulator AlpA